jgi:hypothetical protein
MTTAEIIEQLNTKKSALEKYRADDPPVDAEQVKALEEEIKQLEASLSTTQTPPRKRRAAFLDECAG